MPPNINNHPTIAVIAIAATRGRVIARIPKKIRIIDTAIAQPLALFKSPTGEVLIAFPPASFERTEPAPSYGIEMKATSRTPEHGTDRRA
jgi:hypothetical protein